MFESIFSFISLLHGAIYLFVEEEMLVCRYGTISEYSIADYADYILNKDIIANDAMWISGIIEVILLGMLCIAFGIIVCEIVRVIKYLVTCKQK